MPAIAPSRLAGLLLALAATVSDQQSVAVRRQLGNVAIALSDRRVELAMDSFDKSFDGYSQLRTYFNGLVEAYAVVNELDVLDEDITGNEATLTVHWTLTLSDRVSGVSENREQDVTIKLSMKKQGWRIVDLSPLEFFNPDQHQSK